MTDDGLGTSPPESVALEIPELPAYVTARLLPNGGIGFTIDAKAEKFWPLAITLLIIGPIGIAGGLLLPSILPPEWKISPMASSPTMLLITGICCTCFAPMMIVFQLVNGPSRNIELEAVPGQLKADRSIAGDRVRSTYTPGDVKYFFFDGGQLHIETKKGNSPLIRFGDAAANEAIAISLAQRLWSPEEILIGRPKVPRFSSAPAQCFIFPKSALDAVEQRR